MAVNNSSNLRQIDTDSGSAIVTAAVPNWEVVGGTGISTSASGNTITITNTAGASSLVQQVRAQSNASVSTTKTLSSTTTTPTTSNTDLVLSATITPTSASNFLVIDFITPYSADTDGVIQFCLFQGTTFLTGFPMWQNGASVGAERNTYMNFTYYLQAPSTSATTYNVYWASSAGATLRTLQNSSGTSFYNGSNTKTQIIITEIAV